jgi:hypothetical protein
MQQVNVRSSGRSILRSAAVACGVVLLGAVGAGAQSVTVSAVEFGWFQDTGRHIANNQNYGIGQNDSGYQTRAFFLFDLSSLTLDPAKSYSATFAATNYVISIIDPSETLALYEASTDPAELSIDHAIDEALGQSIFADLGNGTVYGTQVYTPADSGPGRKAVTLSSAAVDAIRLKAGAGSLVIGGALTTLGTPGRTEFIFGGANTVSVAPALTLTVIPEPTTLTFAALMAALAARRNRVY